MIAAADTARPPVHAGVVDIGSNSVRLVIYAVRGRGAIPIFNEKVMAGLGAGLSRSGVLSPAGATAALSALERYGELMEQGSVSMRMAFATAAIRVAKDGPDFARKAGKLLSTRVHVLSGREEGVLSAEGVRRAVHGAEGWLGDLGGSSLELAELATGEVRSLLVGPLALAELDGARQSEAVVEALRECGLKPPGKGVFNAVGGAMRAVFKTHAVLADRSFPILHGTTIPASELRESCERMAALDPDALDAASRAAGRRAATIEHSARLMLALLDWGGFESVVLSTHGVREGALSRVMGWEGKPIDPLLDDLALHLSLPSDAHRLGADLSAFAAPLAPLYRGVPERIVAAACMSANAAVREHPDHRADILYARVATTPAAALTNEERLMLAGSLSYRCSKRGRFTQDAEDALSAKQLESAQTLGRILRLGCALTGRAPRVLSACKLDRRGGSLFLHAPPAHGQAPSVCKRLEQLAEHLGLEPEVADAVTEAA